MAAPSANDQAAIDAFLSTFKDTDEQALFTSKSELAIDTDRKDAKGEKWKFTKKIVVVYKDFHLLDLIEISCSSVDATLVHFRFKSPKSNPVPIEGPDNPSTGPSTAGTVLVSIRDARSGLLVKSVRESLRKMTCGIHPYYDVKVVIPPDQLEELSPTFAVGSANGFQMAYYGQSNYFRTTPKKEVIQYVDDLYAQNITEFDISEVPGAEGKSEISIDFGTLGAALQHNTFFQSIKLVDVPQKSALSLAGAIAKYNGTITKLVIRNAGSDCPSDLGESLGKNSIHQVQILDISGNHIDVPAMVSFGLGIRELTRQITVLGLANCNLSERSLNSLFSALKSNWGFSLSLQEFDLSGNRFDGTVNEVFASWLGSMKGHSRLRRLGLSGVGLDGVKVLPELKLQLNLEYLDLSNNNLRKVSNDAWNAEIPASSKLRVFNLANTNIGYDVVCIIMAALFANPSLSNLALNFSGLDVGHKGGKSIADCLKYSKNLEEIDLSLNGFGKTGGIPILNNLPPTVTKLHLNGNFGQSQVTEFVDNELTQFIQANETLTYLSLVGKPKNRMRHALAGLGKALQSNMSITYLDLSDNHMKDAAFASLCLGLRTNTKLTTFKFDGNALTISGHQAFLRTIWYNRFITDWDYPFKDLMDSGNTARHRKVLNEIQKHILGNGEPTWQPPSAFDWFVDWAIPSAPAPAFVDIPEYLKAATPDDHITMAQALVTPAPGPEDVPPTPVSRPSSSNDAPAVTKKPSYHKTKEMEPPEDIAPPPRMGPPPEIQAAPAPRRQSKHVKNAPPPAPESPVAPPPAPSAKSTSTPPPAPPPPPAGGPPASAGPPPPPPAPAAASPPPPPPAAAVPPPPPPASGPPPPPASGPPPPPPAAPSAAPPAPKASKSKTSKSKSSHSGAPKLGGGDPNDRGGLLSSINGFKGGLKKTVTNDRSAPIVTQEKSAAPGGLPGMY